MPFYFPNFFFRFGPDLGTILEQISRVSPLLSPIVNISTSLNENNSDSLDNLKQEINDVITSKSDQNGSKNNLKRPNTDGLIFNFVDLVFFGFFSKKVFCSWDYIQLIFKGGINLIILSNKICGF